MATLPKTMKALYLTKYVEDNKSPTLEEHFEVKEVPLPTPGPGEVLVKIACSPINPSDLSTLNGTYNVAQREELPCQLGYEGSGTVVASGGGMYGYCWYLQGKRVACVVKKGGRMWAEYAVIPAFQIIPLPDEVTFEQGSSCFVNPLTVIAFVEIAKSKNAKSIVHTAGASGLGKMLIKYAKQEGIDVIAVVRREAQAEILQKECDAKYIINSSESDWEEKMKTMMQDLDCHLGFEAVAGDLSGQVLKAMPRNSTLHVYGGLSQKHCAAIRPTDLIFQNKTLTGFWLTAYLKGKSLIAMKSMTGIVANNLTTSLGTSVRISYPLDKAADAVRDYANDMSAGKVAFSPVTEEKGSD